MKFFLGVVGIFIVYMAYTNIGRLEIDIRDIRWWFLLVISSIGFVIFTFSNR